MGFLTYAAVTGVSALVASTGVGIPLLGFMGFGAAGVGAGTMAAAAQAYVGNVAAGSLFAAAQALAAAPVLP